MKKIFTLAFSIIISSTLFASGEFFIKLNSNGNYTVSLNNQIITNTGSVFRFFDLYSGNYNLKVYENGFNGRTIFEQTVNVLDGYRIVAELDRYTGLKIIEKIPFTQSSWYVDHLQNYNNNWYPNNPKPSRPKCGNNWNHNWNNQQGWNNNWNNGWGNGSNNNYPNYPGNYGYGNVLEDNEVQSLLSVIKNSAFDDKKIEIIKSALKNRMLKTDHVSQLMQQFSFEQNKLTIAKYCYDKTMDKNNYYTLYDDFAFSNSSSQLAKYIESK